MSDGVFRRHRKSGDVFQAQVRVRPEGAPRDGSEDIYESRNFSDYDQALDWQQTRTAEIKGELRVGRHPTRIPQAMFGNAVRWGLDILDRRIEASRLAGQMVDGSTSNDKNLRAKLKWWLWENPEEPDEEKRIERTDITRVALVSLDKWKLKAVTEGALAAGDGGTATQIHRINAVAWLFKLWRDEHKLTETQLPTPTDEARFTAPAGRSRRCRDAQAAGTDKLDEEAALLTEARLSKSTWLAPAIIISIDTAIRQDELVSLNWGDVFTGVAKPYIHLRAQITKGAKGERGGKERTVPLSKRAVEAFHELKAVNEAEVTTWNAEHPDRPPRKTSPKPVPVATPRAVGHAWDTMIDGARTRAVEGGMSPEDAEESIFPDLKWHDLRHEGVSRWFERTTWSEMRISTMAGHSSLETTRIYTHLRGQDVEVEADGLTDDPGTVKLTEAGIMVLSVKGEWLQFQQTRGLTRAHAEAAIRDAASELDRIAT